MLLSCLVWVLVWVGLSMLGLDLAVLLLMVWFGFWLVLVVSMAWLGFWFRADGSGLRLGFGFG